MREYQEPTVYMSSYLSTYMLPFEQSFPGKAWLSGSLGSLSSTWRLLSSGQLKTKAASCRNSNGMVATTRYKNMRRPTGPEIPETVDVDGVGNGEGIPLSSRLGVWEHRISSIRRSGAELRLKMILILANAIRTCQFFIT